MLTCKEITELATDFAEGHLAEEVRRQFVAHVAGCHGCGEWVRQLTATSRAVGALPAPPLPAALEAALLAQFDGWARERATSTEAARAPQRPSRLSLAPAAAAVLAFGLLLGMARSPSSLPADWLVAAGLLVVAVAVAVRWRRLTLGAAAVAAGSALLAAVATGGGGPLEAAEGLECVLTVCGTAAAAAGAGWALLRRRPDEELPAEVGAWAVAAALGALAALQVACGARSSLAHLLTFHLGGLLAVLVVAALAPRLLPRPARA